MTVRDKINIASKKTRRSWHERLIILTLILGGLVTLTWTIALFGLAWRIVGALAGTPG